MAKINLDFDIIDSGNPYYLSLYDTSDWGVIKEKQAILEIVKPGEELPITFIFSKNSVNVFNSNKLEEVCLEDCIIPEKVMLSDGLYKITLKGSPDTYSKGKLHLKTDSFELELSKLFINYYTNCDSNPELLSKITEIKFLIQGAKSAVRFHNITLGNSLWNKAVSLLEDFKNCLNK